MKKKFTYFVAAVCAALTFSACSSDKLEAYSGQTLENPESPSNAISFGTYMGKTGITRSGATGSYTKREVSSEWKTANYLLGETGFGVIAYYTENNDYLGTVATGKNPETALSGTPATDLTSSQIASVPAADFMFNEKIYADGTSGTGADAANAKDVTSWKYDRIKYWPNGNATADDQDNNGGTDPAVGTPGGKVSFFAYAPYVTFPLSGTGIVAINGETTLAGANVKTGNPTITYQLASDGNIVDLLWGTAGTNGVKAQEGDVANNGAYVAKTPATPAWSDNPKIVNVNLTKQKTTGKVEFAFKHALAKIGGSKVGSTVENGLMIIADVDNDGSESGGSFQTGTVNSVDGTKLTKITVKSIEISNDLDNDGDFDGDDKTAGAVVSKGTFDLATGQWTPSSSDDDKTEIKHIINKDGVSANAILATAIAETTAPAKGDADNFFTNASTWENQTGVPDDKPINVYKTETNPFIFIPGTAPILRFKINYVVRTYDANLDKGFSDVEQVISKKVTFPTVVLNKQYNVLIHLGLTSVKFTATVSDLDVNTTDSDSDNVPDTMDKDIYLPINVSD